MSQRHEECIKKRNQECLKAIGCATLFWAIAGLSYFNTSFFFLHTPLVQDITNSSIPVMPWTIAIYMSLYFQPVFCLVYGHYYGSVVFKHMNKMYLMAIVIATLFYVIIPIQIKHAPIVGNDMFTVALNYYKEHDVLYNAYPSTHTMYSLLGPCFLLHLHWSKRMTRASLILLVWGILITASTLTTAQHHYSDLIGGIAGAIVLSYFFARDVRNAEIARIKELRAYIKAKKDQNMLAMQS